MNTLWGDERPWWDPWWAEEEDTMNTRINGLERNCEKLLDAQKIYNARMDERFERIEGMFRDLLQSYKSADDGNKVATSMDDTKRPKVLEKGAELEKSNTATVKQEEARASMLIVCEGDGVAIDEEDVLSTIDGENKSMKSLMKEEGGLLEKLDESHEITMAVVIDEQLEELVVQKAAMNQAMEMIPLQKEVWAYDWTLKFSWAVSGLRVWAATLELKTWNCIKILAEIISDFSPFLMGQNKTPGPTIRIYGKAQFMIFVTLNSKWLKLGALGRAPPKPPWTINLVIGVGDDGQTTEAIIMLFEPMDTLENLRETILFQAASKCYGPDAETFDGRFDRLRELRIAWRDVRNRQSNFNLEDKVRVLGGEIVRPIIRRVKEELHISWGPLDRWHKVREMASFALWIQYIFEAAATQQGVKNRSRKA